MTRLRLLYCIMATVCFVSFTSCDDDDDDEPSQQALLTAGEWEGASIYFDGQDLTQFFRDSVDLDIRELSYRFDDNGEYRQTYGRTVLGTWEFSDANKQKVLFDKGETYEDRATINELTSSDLHLEVLWFGPPVELRFRKP